ncbi:MAG: type II toxin-antitoxin system VapC family toxin [Chitinophagaceae bacterium]|nr:type II toxin-antitoxin system VapC family toxin [Chitinophagaceae bacterium]
MTPPSLLTISVRPDKEKPRLVAHSRIYNKIFISSITEFEVINGATPAQLDFWNNMLTGFTVLDFDSKTAREAAVIVKQLKNKRKSIDKPDLFIAATAVFHGLTLDTNNKKHFENIDSLVLLKDENGG